MKKRSKHVALLCAAMLMTGNLTQIPAGITAAAVDLAAVSGECGEGVSWEYDRTSSTLHISGQGEMSFYFSPWDVYRDAIKKVEIGEGVTSIEREAFNDCKALTEVTLPASVEVIRANAFSGCTLLSSVTLPEGLTSISRYAFDGTAWQDSLRSVNGLVIVGDILLSGQECKGDVIIPDSVRMIAGSAFLGCEELSSVTIPESVTIIDNGAFARSALSSIVIPDSVQKIGYSAFAGCTSLTDCTLPAGLKKLDHSLFEGCTSLRSITIPDTVTEIGYRCFDSSGLTSIELPDSVRTIYAGAFWGCSSLLHVGMTDSVTDFGALPKEQDYIGTGGLGEARGIFRSCTALKEVRLSDSLTELGGRCFEGCTSLEEITLPAKLTNVFYQDFLNCTSLKTVKFPDILENIGNSVFANCALTKITIPSGVREIDRSAFSGCPLQSISVESGNRYFSSSDGILFNNDRTELLLYPCNKTAVNYKVPNETRMIADQAFAGASNLRQVMLTRNVTSIEDSAFSSCAVLEHVWLYNPYCQIKGWGGTVCNGYVETEEGFYSPAYSGVIHGYQGSTAQNYAEAYGYRFSSIGEMPETVQGDVNADSSLNVADVVLLQKWLLAVPNTSLPNWKAADLCEDDKLNVFDLCMMKRALLDQTPQKLTYEGLSRFDMRGISTPCVAYIDQLNEMAKSHMYAGDSVDALPWEMLSINDITFGDPAIAISQPEPNGRVSIGALSVGETTLTYRLGDITVNFDIYVYDSTSLQN